MSPPFIKGQRITTPGEAGARAQAISLAQALTRLLVNAESVEWTTEPPPGAVQTSFFIVRAPFLVVRKRNGDTPLFLSFIVSSEHCKAVEAEVAAIQEGGA
jgi:hypothetical protein